MQHRYRLGWLVVAAVFVVACSRPQTPPGASPVSPAQPYAGLQAREIRALAPETIRDLLEGRGAGYALAAELNHYPGPTHILELARGLNLSSDQEHAVREIFNEMQNQAKNLGGQLVDLERELDVAFRTGQVTAARLEQLTQGIATIEGRLRYTHLAAHLRARDILAADQVNRYNQLRGYITENGAPGNDVHGGGQHPGH